MVDAEAEWLGYFVGMTDKTVENIAPIEQKILDYIVREIFRVVGAVVPSEAPRG